MAHIIPTGRSLLLVWSWGYMVHAFLDLGVYDITHSCSPLSPKWVKSNGRRKKREKISANNGQLHLVHSCWPLIPWIHQFEYSDLFKFDCSCRQFIFCLSLKNLLKICPVSTGSARSIVNQLHQNIGRKGSIFIHEYFSQIFWSLGKKID